MVAAFLDDDYVVPQGGSGGKYVKPSSIPADTTYRIRFLSERPLMGWEYWVNDENGKPKAKRLPFIKDHPTHGKPATPPADAKINLKTGKPDPVKHFWAVVAWDYQQKDVVIFTITQTTIHGKIRNLAKDMDWGSPCEYDLKFTRSGEGTDTVYEVTPSPNKQPLSAEIVEAMGRARVNINLIMQDGGDAFAVGDGEPVHITPSSGGSAEGARLAAIAKLQQAAKRAGCETLKKMRAALESDYDHDFKSFDELTMDQIQDYTGFFEGMVVLNEKVDDIDLDQIPF